MIFTIWELGINRTIYVAAESASQLCYSNEHGMVLIRGWGGMGGDECVRGSTCPSGTCGLSCPQQPRSQLCSCSEPSATLGMGRPILGWGLEAPCRDVGPHQEVLGGVGPCFAWKQEEWIDLPITVSAGLGVRMLVLRDGEGMAVDGGGQRGVDVRCAPSGGDAVG